jgi:hypothetical protein
MKTIFYSILFSFFFFSCKKQIDFPTPAALNNQSPSYSPGYMTKIRTYLKSQMPDSLYKTLDTTSGVLTRESSYYFRLGFLGQKMDHRFVLLTTDSIGNVSDGKIIELSRVRTSALSAAPATPEMVFNGELRIRTIGGESVIQSTITNGFVDAWKGNQSRTTENSTGLNIFQEEEPDPIYQDLPEVTIYPTGSGGDSDDDLYLLLSGLNGGYTIVGGSVIYTHAASPGALPVTNSIRSQVITVDASYQKAAINVKAFLNCFTAVPDAGATYSVNVYVDLPVNDDPTQFFNPYTGATGHVFVGLTKTGGSQSITQYMGFTADNALSAITASGAVPGKIVDNGSHKYNASLSTPVSAAEFSDAMNQLQNQSSAEYDIVNYNCVDFALAVVNSARGEYPLTIAQDLVPGETTPMSTPEALYNTINNMSRPGGPEAGNTNVGDIWDAGTSHGACN